jgi:hypothetical protein
MPAGTTQARRAEPVKQFSVFTANRLGRLHEMVRLLSSQNVHILALTVLDTTDSAILRLIVDDPDNARALLVEHAFSYTESDLLVVELPATTELAALMAGFLEAEININYLYSFITHPGGKSLIAVSVEDNEMAEQALTRRQFRVLKQTDISR